MGCASTRGRVVAATSTVHAIALGGGILDEWSTAPVAMSPACPRSPATAWRRRRNDHGFWINNTSSTSMQSPVFAP